MVQTQQTLDSTSICLKAKTNGCQAYFLPFDFITVALSIQPRTDSLHALYIVNILTQRFQTSHGEDKTSPTILSTVKRSVDETKNVIHEFAGVLLTCYTLTNQLPSTSSLWT